MKAAIIHYDNGHTDTTNINGTDEEIREYFKVGKYFNLGNGEHDLMAKVASVEIEEEMPASYKKDTVMSDKQIEEFMGKLCANPILLAKAIEYIQTSYYQAGVKDVVDWVESDVVGDSLTDELYKDWQAHKKEWGITT